MGDEAGALALVGPGRAGVAVAAALVTAGWRVVGVAGRSPDAPSTRAAGVSLEAPPVPVAQAAAGADVVLVATPDAAIAQVVAAIAPAVSASTLVVHLSGSLGLDVLAPVAAAGGRAGALHPLQSLPSSGLGLSRLRGSWCAVAGDPQVYDLAAAMGMHPMALADADRVRYHAAACVASNHLVALLAQVERLAPVPLEAYLPLVRATVENVAELGPAGALTGPVARGDVETVRAHLAVLPEKERDAYRALAREAVHLAGNARSAMLEVLA
ncbi:MAG: DUF2520 domain-containing protein [Actinobacteria bacterium]|nr:DUF2520 domain-containing protein [Actinomycetota bacterium]